MPQNTHSTKNTLASTAAPKTPEAKRSFLSLLTSPQDVEEPRIINGRLRREIAEEDFHQRREALSNSSSHSSDDDDDYDDKRQGVYDEEDKHLEMTHPNQSGWSQWQILMSPSKLNADFVARKSFGYRNRGFVSEGVGLYEMRIVKDDVDEVVYLGKAGSVDKENASTIQKRLDDYKSSGSHKSEQIDIVLEKGFTIYARTFQVTVATRNTLQSDRVVDMERHFLDIYDYRWNYQHNRGYRFKHAERSDDDTSMTLRSGRRVSTVTHRATRPEPSLLDLSVDDGSVTPPRQSSQIPLTTSPTRSVQGSIRNYSTSPRRESIFPRRPSPVRAAPRSQNRATSSNQCQGIIKTGARCSRDAKNGDYCWQHVAQETESGRIRSERSIQLKSSVQCSGTKRDGHRCSKMTKDPSGICGTHADQRG